MLGNEFIKKVDDIIAQMPQKINKVELRQKVLEMILSRNITKKECEITKKLMKSTFTMHASIEEQSMIQAKIETLCNSI